MSGYPHMIYMLIRLRCPHKTNPQTTRLTTTSVKVNRIQTHRTAPSGLPNSCNLGMKKCTQKLTQSHWHTLWKAARTHCKLRGGHCGERREGKRSTEPEPLLPKSKRWTIKGWSSTHQKGLRRPKWKHHGNVDRTCNKEGYRWERKAETHTYFDGQVTGWQIRSPTRRQGWTKEWSDMAGSRSYPSGNYCPEVKSNEWGPKKHSKCNHVSGGKHTI